MEWVLTYAVHSTALIATVWLLTSVIPTLSLGTKEALWKVALLGPLLTATVHQVAGVPSVWGPLPVPQALRTEASTAPPASAVAPAAPPSDSVIERRIVRHRTGELEITAIRQRHAAPAVAPVAPAVAPVAPAASTALTPWPLVLLGLWLAGAAFALGRLAWGAHRLRTQLAGRRDVIEDPVLESFLDLCSKAGLKKRPRLTASPHLRSPIALGRREICLPERAVDSLTPQQQHGMLAHEMAHLLRRDPLWMVAAATVEAVFFFQPLNHLARRKIQEVAEYQCDDWAARQSGTGVHLATCLAEVAGWVEDGPPISPAVTAMADRSSPIVRRITRLLHERRKGGRVHPAGRVALTVGTLGLVIALVPGVTQAGGGSIEAPSSAPVLATAAAAASPRAVIFEDHSDDGHDRSRLRLHTDDEIVEIEIQAPRPLPPPPPPAPHDDRLEITIHGFGGLPWGCCWGWGGGWLGLLDAELGLGWEVIVEDADPWGWQERVEQARARAERVRERAERVRERAERVRERAQRRLERDREREHHGLFGVVWGGEPPADVEADEGCTYGHSCVVEL